MNEKDKAFYDGAYVASIVISKLLSGRNLMYLPDGNVHNIIMKDEFFKHVEEVLNNDGTRH